MNFHNSCGEIYSKIKAELRTSAALRNEPYDWWMTECDLSVDTKVPQLGYKINESRNPG